MNLIPQDLISKKDAIELLKLDEKVFNNYAFFSKELKAVKIKGRWFFNKKQLEMWTQLRRNRTVVLSLKEYELCFQFAIKMAYSNKASHGTGIRGTRSQVQMADDFILGILAEFAVKKFLKDKLCVDIELDTEVHPDHITEQDLQGVVINGELRRPNIGIAIKSSKIKSCFNVIPPIEYENASRKSDVYIFARVGLPSDHLFRILREHSFFKTAKDFLERTEGFKKIEKLETIPVWICGFSLHNELEKVTEIPGQVFDGHRYVKSVAEMHNSDKDWEDLIDKI